MEIDLYQLDAFSDQVFGGNPAAVCPLDRWLDDATLQAIAVENNLSETAFLVAEDGGYHLRWFTPGAEVDLCGHATLAAGDVVLRYLGRDRESVRFRTLGGTLHVKRVEGGLLEMDFPARPAEACELPDDLLAALGAGPGHGAKARDFLLVYDSQAQVAALAPDFGSLARVLEHEAPGGGVIVTAPGDGTGGADFVSRFFAPHLGIDEDPVTGSAHCTLVPYWAGRLGREVLTGRQISRRGGTVHCTLAGDRVLLRGHCVEYMRGRITLD